MSGSRPEALIIGETTFPFHDFEDIGPLFRAVLAREADLTLTTDREALVDLSEYDMLVDYLTDSTLTDDQLQGLLAFVEDGGGYVGVHCASDLTSTASDDPDELLDGHEEPQPDLRELIGGHFLTHPEQSEFGVEVVDREHPITEGVEDFRVFDEPYQVEWDEDVRVLAEMDHPDLDRYPVAWTNDYGDGRVYYLSLGHTPDAFGTEGFQHLLVNGLHWAADR